MKAEIEKRYARGYAIPEDGRMHVETCRNVKGGWVDYLLGGRIIFSHRTTTFGDRVGPAFTGRLHAHRYVELVLCLSGTGMTYIADRRQVALSDSAAVITAAETMHLFRPEGSPTYDRYILNFPRELRMTPLDGDGVMGFLSALEDGSLCLNFDEASARRIFKLAARAERQMAEDRPSSTAEAWVTLSEMFLHLSAAAARPDLHCRTETEPPDFICAIKTYIDENYTAIASISDLCTRFFYSREYITRTFRRAYNTPIYEYILSRKLLYSQTLLREGMRVEDAAEQAGFHNMSAYIKQFKRMTGETPSAWRTAQLEGEDSWS